MRRLSSQSGSLGERGDRFDPKYGKVPRPRTCCGNTMSFRIGSRPGCDLHGIDRYMGRTKATVSLTEHTRTGYRRMLSRLSPLTVAVGTAALLAACGSGQIAQTSNIEAAVNGASGQAGAMAIRDAQIAPPIDPRSSYPTGADVPLQLTIVNTGDIEDQLTSVSSPDVSTVSMRGDQRIPPDTALQVTADTGTLASTTSATAPSDSSAPRASSLPSDRVSIVLKGLKTVDLYSGYTVPVVFTFAHAGSLTMNIPVGPTQGNNPKD